MAVLEMRRAESKSEWVFPRDTASGHVEASTLKKQHEAAIKSAGVSPFVIYDFRHTRITRWAKVLPLPVVQRLAGHTDISTTMRYVHLNDEDMRAAMAKEQEEHGGHTSGHTGKEAQSTTVRKAS
jgi:integrase